MNIGKLKNPMEIANKGLAPRYEKHHGPYSINWPDLNDMFPGIMDIDYPGLNPDVNSASTKTNVPAANYGEMNQSETELLYRLISWLKPKTMIEYGTMFGRSTTIMANQSPEDARVITVDLPDRDRYRGDALLTTDSLFMTDEMVKPENKMPVGGRIHTSPYKNKITPVRMDARSQQFRETLDDFLESGPIDFALIDAAHDYFTTKDLFEYTLPLMSEGGVIMTDDYGKVATHNGILTFFGEKAIKEGYVFYWLCPFGDPNYKDPGSLIYINVDGAQRDWGKGNTEFP